MNWILQYWDPSAINGLFKQFLCGIHKQQFWFAVGKIIWINVLLSGDNALVIALACRGLQPRQRLWGMSIGAAAAVILLIGFTGIVAILMALPYLKLTGGLALLVIAAKLLVPDVSGDVAEGTNLWHAVRIVVIADIVMSLDNIIAVAAAADGQLPLLIIGLAVSIPIIIAGASLIMRILDRLPILIWLGATLLGWIAGDMIATDVAVGPQLRSLLDGEVSLDVNTMSSAFSAATHVRFDSGVGELASASVCAIVVLLAGSIWRKQAIHKMPGPAVV